jgi:esterase
MPQDIEVQRDLENSKYLYLSQGSRYTIVLMLQTYHYGDASTPVRPLLIAHGLYGSGRNWNVIAKRMGAHRPVITVDMRNHGDSPHFATHSYYDMADDLSETILNTHEGPIDVIGHSMGGKAAMMLALRHPERVARLVVADIAPVTYGHSQIQYVHAMQRLTEADMASRASADLALAAQVPDAALRAFLLQSLDLKSIPPRWRLNLPVLEREMPQIIGWPGITATFDRPTLFLSGAKSDYVKTDDRPQIKRLFPKARFAKIPGAGHWLHAEKPREFEAALEVFMPVATR